MTLLDKCNNLMIPSQEGIADVLVAVLPDDDSGNYDVARDSVASRINTNRLIENVAANVPRLDYSDGGCPALLLEPQSTNLTTYSEDLSNWNLLNIISSIDGIWNELTDTNDVSATTHRMYASVSALTIGNNYTVSFYAKEGTLRYLYCSFISGGDATDRMSGLVDLHDGTWLNTASGSGVTELGTTSEPYQGGYRFTLTFTNAKTQGLFYLGLQDSDGFNISTPIQYQGDGTGTVYVNYCQYEEQDYATSYIGATTTGSVTRIGDVVNGAAYAGSSESGVLYVNMAALADNLSGRAISVNIGDASTRAQIQYTNVTNEIRAEIKIATSVIALFNHPVADITDYSKIALRWANANFSLWIDSVKVGEQLSGATFGAGVLTGIDFHSGAATNIFYGKNRALETFDYLTDAEMASLTT